VDVESKADDLTLKKYFFAKSKKLETGWFTALAESSKEGHGSKRAACP
jgi:hypothetical protein